MRSLVRILFAIAALGLTAAACQHSQPTVTPKFSGSASCAVCHPAQHAQWLESNHRHAMEKATVETVFGDFRDVELEYFGRKTRFTKAGDSFLVTTENQQGQPQTFTIAYTLGYRPLQQYLVNVGGGRIQALPFAWDTREKKEGGQRWFHLYPKENVAPDNPLFWTRPLQNWNHMCGDCHTTGFAKNVSDAHGGFDSKWSEQGNGCESCHGAGSTHIEARRSGKTDESFVAVMDGLHRQQSQIDQCGACHARRVRLRDEVTRDVMFETWRPQLPQEGLYFADGQIREEVFEIGSFLQSKMAAKGVRCTDCHDPHTARLRAEGNALCTQCHVPETYDTTAHHFHSAGTPGAQCVECHMPARTYMVVDDRRDHRFAIPRPDLSESIGTPNPCVGCHKGRTNSWAAEAVRRLAAGQKATTSPTLGVVAWQLLHEQATGAESLRSLVADSSVNPIAKAAALASIRELTPESLGVTESALSAKDPLIRLGAMQAISALSLPQRVPRLINLVHDPYRVVQMEAARLLAGADVRTLTELQRANLDNAINAYRERLLRDADRAEALSALGELQTAQGDAVSARESFEKAITRDDTSLVTLLNYADFHRAQGNDPAAEALLTRASTLYPDSANVHLALGLLRVRQKRPEEAIPELERAARLAPDDSHALYVYAVGLYSTGRVNLALSVLDKAQARYPANTQIRQALQAYCANQQTVSICSRFSK